eukprot:518440-Pyramimonas_sp.AAC.1
MPGLTRRAHRARELAKTAMVEATAAARAQRALESQTRSSGQDPEQRVGEFVDIPRKTEKAVAWEIHVGANRGRQTSRVHGGSACWQQPGEQHHWHQRSHDT